MQSGNETKCREQIGLLVFSPGIFAVNVQWGPAKDMIDRVPSLLAALLVGESITEDDDGGPIVKQDRFIASFRKPFLYCCDILAPADPLEICTGVFTLQCINQLRHSIHFLLAASASTSFFIVSLSFAERRRYVAMNLPISSAAGMSAPGSAEYATPTVPTS